MVDSKQLNNKLKTTPKNHEQLGKPQLLHQQLHAAEENSEDFIERKRKIVGEELENHQEKLVKLSNLN